jgi:hypothetical protein
MGDPEIGWIAAIIIGGIAGWLAERFMKSDYGIANEYRARHRRSGNCERHFQLLWNRPRRVDWVLDCRVHRRVFADLGGPGATGPHSVRTDVVEAAPPAAFEMSEPPAGR